MSKIKPKITSLKLTIAKSFWEYKMSCPLHILASHLKISKKTIYRLFKNKSSLIEFTVQLKMNEFEGSLKSIMGRKLDPVEELAQVTFYWEKFIAENYIATEVRRYLPVAIYSRTERKYLSIMNDVLKANVQNGIVHGVFSITDQDLTARFYLTHLENLKKDWIYDSGQRWEFLSNLVDHHLSSLQLTQGKQ